MFKVTSVLWKILINVKYCLSQLMALENVQVKYQYYLFKSIMLISNNEVFNLPFTIDVKNNYFEKKIFTKINSKKIRLKIGSNEKMIYC